MINEQHFFEQLRATKFITKLTQKQVDGFVATLTWFNELYPNADLRKVAYTLASFWHESAFTMQPVEEIGKGKGMDYGKRLKMSRKPYTDTTNLFYGRGPIQTTWYENYEKMGELLGVDLIKHPELLLEMEYGFKSSIIGIMEGLYTGKGLGRYFSKNICDPYFARRCVNGMKIDKANPKKKVDKSAINIEKYYNNFLKCLQRHD